MTLPSWRDPKLGSMVRAALWLETEVGEGNIFTKNRLREAFPDVSQIDRRIRDLRDYGWQLDTRREDVSLRQEEQRFAKRGAEVWLPELRAKAKPKDKSGLSAAQRTKIMADDDFQCRSCGAAAGDVYEDGVSVAQLDITRRQVKLPDGTEDVQLVTECARCRVGGRGRAVDLGEVIGAVTSLSPLEQEIFADWLDRDRRTFSTLEKIWATYRTLPKDARAEVRKVVSGSADDVPAGGQLW
ncbi:hypothetical protein SAMN05421805_110128 [Saccharopolyspora antimicrobica]|uniref:HNH endonuclease n=1 Tax=Saccharopolyspora antimicrobica TaxID=455193 RepID=A0A1I5F0N6_9PSEU|nr:hypothetical protein [Saccharopolyspora antimicrobica]RKT83628.1 hypothetical protein ATL45_1922 [Saccharopolyspora antimicrobica]SFO17358.1 hypothetical protein SAMN05421805_110128 [Saccharopolyspora antimicrobica]